MKFLSIEQVLKLHARAIACHGGCEGVRDHGALDAAVAMPKATFGGELLHGTVPEGAAAYLFHLCQNHPFLDGNKRVAWASANTFLRVNGHVCHLPNDEVYGMVLDVAAGKLDKRHLTSIFEVALREEKV